MTKAELEKEAENYAREWLYHVKDLELYHKEDDKPEYIRIKEAYLASAEPREKQIQIDAEQIRNLQKQNGELTDKVKELEAQIEKMKCWCNCKNYLSCLEEYCRKNISFEKGICYNCKKWELRR